MQQHYKPNTKYEILTPNGWEDFDGVIKNTNTNKSAKTLTFENEKFVTATDEHRFFVNGIEAPVHALQVGTTLDGSNGNIVSIEPCTLEDTYEVFNATNHRIIVNGIISHQCDEFAFVKPHIAREFYDSVLPTISTGGHMIVSSTPNGDVGQYAELWRGAKAKLNDFQYGVTYVPWDAPPGRDEAFKRKFIGLLGERKWRQEYQCEFLTEELTLIDSDIVTRAEQAVAVKVNNSELIAFAVNDNKFQFFKRLEKGMTYLVGVDPSTGSGADNGVIQVYEFPSMEQVLEYSTQTLSPQVMYTELKSLLNFLHTVTDEVYFSVENNGVGQGILAAYEGDLDPPYAALVSESGKKGVNSNTKTKLQACLQFKGLMERGKVTINSPQLLTELKSFIRHSGSYAAQTGATDDRIMATIVVFYIIQQMSSNNGDAYDIVYSVASEIEERHGWKAEINEEHMRQPIERSEAVNEAFKSLHDTTLIRDGIFL